MTHSCRFIGLDDLLKIKMCRFFFSPTFNYNLGGPIHEMNDDFSLLYITYYLNKWFLWCKKEKHIHIPVAGYIFQMRMRNKYQINFSLFVCVNIFSSHILNWFGLDCWHDHTMFVYCLARRPALRLNFSFYI